MDGHVADREELAGVDVVVDAPEHLGRPGGELHVVEARAAVVEHAAGVEVDVAVAAGHERRGLRGALPAGGVDDQAAGEDDRGGAVGGRVAALVDEPRRPQLDVADGGGGPDVVAAEVAPVLEALGDVDHVEAGDQAVSDGEVAPVSAVPLGERQALAVGPGTEVLAEARGQLALPGRVVEEPPLAGAGGVGEVALATVARGRVDGAGGHERDGRRGLRDGDGRLAVFDGSALLWATTWNVPAVDGAVYAPVSGSTLPPPASLTDQVTVGFVPVTVAVKVTVVMASCVAVMGETVTLGVTLPPVPPERWSCWRRRCCRSWWSCRRRCSSPTRTRRGRPLVTPKIRLHPPAAAVASRKAEGSATLRRVMG